MDPEGQRSLQGNWILHIVTLLLIFGGAAESHLEITRPTSCDHTETWYRQRRSYAYHYQNKLDVGFIGTNDVITGHLLSCDVTVQVPKRCEVLIMLSNCNLQEKGMDGQMTPSENGQRLAMELEQNGLYVQMDRGQVLDQVIVVSEDEPEHVTNIKRAIVSQLQLPILPSKMYDQPVVQSDIFGDCPMTVTFDPESDVMNTRRDLTLCKNMPQIFGSPRLVLSLAKQFQTELLKRSMDEMTYPFASEVDCQYDIGTKTIDGSECVHYQAFHPITYDGRLTATPTFNFTQSLKLASTGKLSRRQAVVRRSLDGRRVTPLHMHIDMAPARDVTSQQVHEALDGVLMTYSSQSSDLPPERFGVFVDVLRDAGQDTLEKALASLMTCRGAGECPLQTFSGQLESQLVQKLRESFFTDGLLSCGTEACVATYMLCVQKKLTFDLEGELALANLGLFYEPHPSAVNNMLNLCKTTPSTTCWLSLGSLVGRLAKHVTDDASVSNGDGHLHPFNHGLEDAEAYAMRAKEAMGNVLKQLRVSMGDTCKPGALSQIPKPEQADKLADLVVALKTLGNAGQAIQDFYDDLTANGKDIVPAVLQCLNNKQLPNMVNHAAMMVLRKLRLEKKVHSALYDLLSNPSHTVSLRTMAFDLLVRHEDDDTTRHLTDVIMKEKLSGLRMYMITRLAHLLESNHPEQRSLRDLWRNTLTKNKTILPEVESMRGRGSKYAEISRYFLLPFSHSHHGGKLAFRVVFDPASVLPGSFRVSVSLLSHNKTLDLLEVGLDLQGLENIARELLGWKALDLKQDLFALVARVMQAALPKGGEAATLLLQDKRVSEGLRKLLNFINMPTGDSPQAEFHVKLLGNEVGYVHLDDVIRMFKVSQMGSDKEPPKLATLAQRLSEGLQFFLGKSSVMVELVKVIPTLGGIPWRAEVRGAMVASAMLNAAGDVSKFMSRKGPLKVVGSLGTSVGVAVMCHGVASIADVTSSGIRVNISVQVNTKVEDARLTFANVPEHKSQVVTLAAGALKRPLHILRVRNDLYLLHNGKGKEVKTPDTQVKVSWCANEFVEKWTGNRVCLEGFYQQLNWSADTPLPIMSGPIHLDVESRPVDTKLKEYAVTFNFTRQEDSPSGTLLILRANASAPGEKLKRIFDTVVKVNPATQTVSVTSGVPEFGFRYDLTYNTTSSATPQSTQHYKLMSSVLSIGPELLHSLIVEDKDVQMTNEVTQTGKVMTFNSSETIFNVNVSFPGLSVEVLTNRTSGKRPGLFTQNFQLRYSCKPDVDFFYALHPRPALAAGKGHVSEWSFSNRAQLSGTSFSNRWSASDKMHLFAPGHNITLINEMVANYSLASRNTVIFWTANQGTPNQTVDVIRMNAEVRNMSVPPLHALNYVMHLEHENKYDVNLTGDFNGTLSNMAVVTDVLYKAKPNRPKRSLRSIYNRLKRVEERIEEVVETAEEMVVRRGVELTDAFMKWLSAEMLPGEGKNATVGRETGYEVDVKPLLVLFARPEWKLHVNAGFRMRPKLEPGKLKSGAMTYGWNLDVTLPDAKKDLIYFNGTFERGTGLNKWDGSIEWLLSSGVMGLQLDYFMEQNIHNRAYHHSRWHLVDYNKHSLDRSFDFMFDVERRDHFFYSLKLEGPNVNLSHSINFSIINAGLRFVRASLNVHNRVPEIDIVYREHSNVTAKGLNTTVALNSTWLDLTLDMDIDWSKPGVFYASQFITSLGKVLFLNGSRQMNTSLEMDMSNRKRQPSLTIVCRSPDGQLLTIFGQLTSPRLVLFTFSSQKPEEKPMKLLDWFIGLEEPTVLNHSLQWNPLLSEPLFQYLLRLYTAGAHSFKAFGQTVGDNVYKNVTDMIIPFTNMTLSQAVDRVVQGHMRLVAAAGLDPMKNVPLKAKILKGGLKFVQALQNSWRSSPAGRITSALGLPALVSGAAKLSTGLHYMLVKDPPYPMRQYIKHKMIPAIHAVKEAAQFNFSVPMPFVWDNFLTRPKPMMLRRQMAQRRELMKKNEFVAVLSPGRIRTFDGVSYNITVPDSKCAYMLGTDLMTGNHSLVLSHNGVELGMRNTHVELSWNGAVHILHHKHAIRELPAALPNDQPLVELEDGLVTILIPNRLLMTFDPVTQIHVIEVPAHAHNRSIGLLGTTTLESGDDFLLPSGKVADNVLQLQNEYELSEQRICQNVASSTSAPKCSQKQKRHCEELSELVSCPPFPRFMELCLNHVCAETGVETSACPVLSAFLKMCPSRDHADDVNKILSASKCDCISSGSSKKNGKVDIIFGSALEGRGNLKSMLNNLATHLQGDIRFGLVLANRTRSHVHIFNDGQLLVAARGLKTSVNKADFESSKQKKGGASVDDIIKMAANYPFRAGSRRFVMLFVDEKSGDLEKAEELEELLWTKDISLALVSSDLEKRVMSVTWDLDVECRGCAKKKIQLPTTGLGKLAGETKGLWISADTLEQHRRNRLKNISKTILKVAQQPAPRCAARGA